MARCGPDKGADLALWRPAEPHVETLLNEQLDDSSLADLIALRGLAKAAKTPTDLAPAVAVFAELKDGHDLISYLGAWEEPRVWAEAE